MSDHVCLFIDLGGKRCCHCGADRPKENPEVEALRARLRDIYHLTLGYGDYPVETLQAIRKVSAPG